MPTHLSTFSSQFSPSPAARHYHPTLSIWLSVDPMADKYPSMSPYTYCANNPVRLVDPDGREIGDYFGLNGKYLGWDGIDDGKVYVVTDRNAISYSYSYDSENHVGFFTINQENIYDIHRIPSSSSDRADIIDHLVEFDSQHPNAEWGGIFGVGINPNDKEHFGKESNYFGHPSEAGDPSSPNSTLRYTQLNAQDLTINGFYVFFDYHSHGSGGWNQEPSNIFDSETKTWKGDIPNAKKRQQSSPLFRRTFAEFAMGEKQVYFYNENGTRGKMSFDSFINIGK